MKHRLSLVITLLAAVLISVPASARASGAPEQVADWIHSDLPLYTFRWNQLWPKSISDAEGFGCSSRVPFGDWQFSPDAANKYGEVHWRRFANYGVFHCAAIFRSADTRDELNEASFQHGFFVRMGRMNLRGEDWELWTLQIGTMPGSDYTLLARRANAMRVEEFTVLQQRCPSGNIRQVQGLDIWTARYCSINSQAELLSLAKRMLRLPKVGVLKRVGSAD